MAVAMWKSFGVGVLAAVLAPSGPAPAATVSLTYDGGTASGWVTISAAPVETASGSLLMTVGAHGLKMTDLAGQLGSFTALCLDISHWLQSAGDYEATVTPFTNGHAIGELERVRLQAVFDANFASVNLGNTPCRRFSGGLVECDL